MGRKMKKIRIYSSILFVVILLTLLPMTARAADEIIEVSHGGGAACRIGK
jgi:predicted secreted protein